MSLISISIIIVCGAAGLITKLSGSAKLASANLVIILRNIDKSIGEVLKINAKLRKLKPTKRKVRRVRKRTCFSGY